VAAMVTGYVPAEVIVVAVATSVPAIVALSVVADANKVVVRNCTAVIAAPAGM